MRLAIGHDRVMVRDSLALSIEAMEPRPACVAGLSLSLAQDTGRSMTMGGKRSRPRRTHAA